MIVIAKVIHPQYCMTDDFQAGEDALNENLLAR
jgi:hypothetical protein